jgi:branched-chain amino acid transport system substrate-binding protein
MFEVVIVIVSALMCASVSSVSSASSGQPSKPPNQRVIHIAGFGALTGPVQSFGINSRAAQLAAADAINRAGGVRLADGSKARLEITYEDDKCNPEQAIDLIRTVASSDALVATGPSCSSVAEPLFSALQHRVGDTQDHGIQLPILTDGATKAGLARLSEWAFRNVADEQIMYRVLWQWIRRTHPGLKTVFGGEEADFAHSHSTWDNIIRATAQSSGLNLASAAKWSLTDTRFDAPVAQMKAAHPDIVVLSAHATTTCGVLKEMAKQGVRPALTVGLTSAASDETLHRCGALAEGLLIPTTFAPITPEARRAAAAVLARHGMADLHSMAAWENIMTLKRVIESAGIVGTHEAVAADRVKIRNGLARLDTIAGLLGTVRRTPDRESRKPFVFVQVKRGAWRVVNGPIAATAAVCGGPVVSRTGRHGDGTGCIGPSGIGSRRTISDCYSGRRNSRPTPKRVWTVPICSKPHAR